MAAGAAFPGLFFCFAAMVLLIFVSVSVPTWSHIYFLEASRGAQTLRFGVFGYTGTGRSIGYTFDPTILGFNNTRLNDATIHNLTKILILHPIAAGLSGLAVLFGLCGAGYHRAGTVFMALVSALATIATILAWVVDMVLFGIARTQFRDQGWAAQYGNATWMTLAAAVALLIGFCTSACGVFGHYRRHRTAY